MTAEAKTLALAALIVGLGLPAQADPYEQLARDLADIARQTGYQRLAVMPLQPITGGGAQSGEILAARLTSRLSMSRDIKIVERALLDQVLQEQGLSYKGVVRAEQAKELGQVLGVDAIVTGTYLKLRRGKLEVHARLIDTETARVLGAATAKVEKEWEDEIMIASADVWDTPPPSIVGFGAPSLGGIPDMRDALADINSCDDWEDRVRAVQSGTIEQRARFWAARLHEPGFRASTLTRNPGSNIRDLGLRQQFYSRTQELYTQNFTAGVTVHAKERLDAADRQVERILEECYY
ncbi:MAG: FlgO family outer membrane protein [Elusimicrobiota bacterium]